MEKSTEAQNTSFKSWAKAIFIWAFLFVWLSGMTAGLTAGACRNDRYEGAKKLRFCNISLTAGAWMKMFPVERSKRAIIQLEWGIALSQLGREENAVEAFEIALRDARSTSGPWEQNLSQRMVQLEDGKMRALWVSVLESAD